MIACRDLIAAGSLAMFIGSNASWRLGLFAVFMTGLTLLSTALGVIYLFELREPALVADQCRLPGRHFFPGGGRPRRVALGRGCTCSLILKIACIFRLLGSNTASSGLPRPVSGMEFN